MLTGNIQSIKEGQFPPEIVSNFANGFGYSWNLFYPPLGGYVISLFRLFTNNYVNAIKLTLLLFLLLAGINMYHFVRDITKKEKTGFITSLIYVTGLYLITDVFVRLNLGEIITYAFAPMVLHGLYNICEEDKNKDYLFVIGMTAIILSHNISTLIISGISAIYIIYGLIKNKKEIRNIIKKLCIDIIFIIGLSIVFYAPFIETILSAKYKVMVQDHMASMEYLKDQALYPQQLLWGKPIWGSSEGLEAGINNEMMFAIGLQIIIPLLLTVVVYKKVSKEKRGLYLLTIITGMMCAIMTTTIWPWDMMPNFFKIIQFPWRLLMPASILLSIIAGINLDKVIVKKTIWEYVKLFLIILIYLATIIPNIIVFNRYWDESYLSQSKLNTGTCGGKFEYLPEKATEQYIEARGDKLIVLSGKIDITKEEKDKSIFICEFENAENNTKLELPYIYYPGYEIIVNGNVVETEMSENGFVQVNLKNIQNGKINLRYSGTIIQKISTIISLITGLIFIIYCITILKKRRRIDEKSFNNNTSI